MSLKQLNLTVKTASAVLTYAEMGDIVVNSASAATLTLPTPLAGLWYRISNANSGVVSVVYNAAILRTLDQYEQLFCLANGSDDWYYVGSSGKMTKVQIESVLTGEISSHSHAYYAPLLKGSAAPTIATVGSLGQFYLATDAGKLYYCSRIEGGAYTWAEGGAVLFTDLADAPGPYAGQGGKLLSVKPTEDGLRFVQGDEAANGLPAGGSAGQLLAKSSAADYDSQWVTGKIAFTATLVAADWAGVTAPYTQFIAVAGILEADQPIVGPAYSGDLAARKLERAAWALVDDIESAAGQIIFTCFEVKPETDINIQGEVVRFGYGI